jgi:hypothetical protein
MSEANCPKFSGSHANNQPPIFTHFRISWAFNVLGVTPNFARFNEVNSSMLFGPIRLGSVKSFIKLHNRSCAILAQNRRQISTSKFERNECMHTAKAAYMPAERAYLLDD